MVQQKNNETIHRCRRSGKHPSKNSSCLACRKIHSFDASTGKLLWEFPTTSGILAPPTSFLVDGKQYIAVHSGWGGDSRGMQATLNRLFPGEYPEVPEGGSVWVFALE